MRSDNKFEQTEESLERIDERIRPLNCSLRLPKLQTAD